MWLGLTMDLPKCKICGERHRLGPCPQNQSQAKAVVDVRGIMKPNRSREEVVSRLASGGGGPKRQKTQGGRSGDVNAGSQAKEEANSVTAGETAPKFDRVAYHREYMREYMRKRRAAKK